MDIVVFGSLNMDLVAQVPRIPQPGETILGSGFTTVPGGKGANQAVAAARLGADTVMVGRVGNDAMGQTLTAQLQTEGIETKSISVSDRAPSGTALITLSPTNNQIVVIPGANGEISEAELETLLPYLNASISGASILLLQFEIPLPIVEKAAALAYTAGMTVIVDPAPAQGPLPLDFCDYISILTPNKSEAELLTGKAIIDIQSAVAAAETLQKQGIDTVIVKLGDMGCVCVTPTGSFAMPVYRVEAVDTVAAGDAFNGGLAAALARSNVSADERLKTDILRDAIDYATTVSAIAVTRSGAQAAMPTATEVEEFIRFQQRANL
ncbi:MAG: ribokinase [Cyanobacteria bacterium J06554_3]